LQTKLIVDGFPSSFTDQDLKDLLAPFGSVISASIARDPKGESLRMGQVEMALPEEAKKVKEKLHLSYVQGKMLLVFWETKETGK
jgi:RNA recognition motif-containing protein